MEIENEATALPHGCKNPPQTFIQLLRHLGPGIIMAASIVGAGELILTTSTGGQVGMKLLWLIIIGSIIKYWMQVEIARSTVMWGKSALRAMNDIPGPRIPLCHTKTKSKGISWILILCTIQLILTCLMTAGLLGGCGQILEMSVQMTDKSRTYHLYKSAETSWVVHAMEFYYKSKRSSLNANSTQEMQNKLDIIHKKMMKIDANINSNSWRENKSIEDLGRQVLLKSSLLTNANDSKIDETDGKELLYLIGYRRFVKLGGNPDSPNMTHILYHQAAKPSSGYDAKIWSAIIAMITMPIIIIGRYTLIEWCSIILLTCFTTLSVANLVILQMQETWRIGWTEFFSGLIFTVSINDGGEGGSIFSALSMAFSTYGIIGAGSGELIMYTFWCMEKGYARFVGTRPRLLDPLLAQEKYYAQWKRRAEGWLKVLQMDVFICTILFTCTTVIFYMLGASLLHRTGLDPAGGDMIRYLSTMYTPAFGNSATYIFLVGAFAVLYSSIFLGTVSYIKWTVETLRIFKLLKISRSLLVSRILGAFFPLLHASIVLSGFENREIILIGGAIHTIGLPLIGITVLYKRYTGCEPGLEPTKLWDAFLIVSVIINSIAAIITLVLKIIAFIK